MRVAPVDGQRVAKYEVLGTSLVSSVVVNVISFEVTAGEGRGRGEGVQHGFYRGSLLR